MLADLILWMDSPFFFFPLSLSQARIGFVLHWRNVHDLVLARIWCQMEITTFSRQVVRQVFLLPACWMTYGYHGREKSHVDHLWQFEGEMKWSGTARHWLFWHAKHSSGDLSGRSFFLSFFGCHPPWERESEWVTLMQIIRWISR